MNFRSSVTADEGIRAIEIDPPESELAKVLRRVMTTRLPVEETATDRLPGVRMARVPQRARYSGTENGWREVAAKLNALPEFVTEIFGLDLRFVHLRSRHSRALPLIMSRGWPGSVQELLKFIGQLTDPTRHGGHAEDAFDVVILSLPGDGSSGQPTATCWGSDRTARACHELMRRLGYERFVCRDSDLGWVVTNVAAR